MSSGIVNARHSAHIAHRHPPRPLAGRVALVTDGTSEVGAGVALALAEAGAAVAVNGEEKAVAELVADIRARGAAACRVEAEPGAEEAVRKMFARVAGELGSVDILISNTGVQHSGPFHVTALADWHKVTSDYLTSQFLHTREAVRLFMARRQNEQRQAAAGKIICIASPRSGASRSGQSARAASVGALRGLMASLARELAVYRIRVNVIVPGVLDAEPDGGSALARAELFEHIPYGRLGDVGDIANAAVWLASDQSDYLTGATLYVDGGMNLPALY